MMADVEDTITGIVGDAAGGIPDVVAELWADHGDRREPIGEAHTDAEGRYAVPVPKDHGRLGLSLRLLDARRTQVLATVSVGTGGPLKVHLSLPAGTPDDDGRARRFVTVAGHRLDWFSAARLRRADLLALNHLLSGRRRPISKSLRTALPRLSARRRAPIIATCAGELGSLGVVLLAQRGWLDADTLASDDDLPEPVPSWLFHYTANVEVAYTLDAANLPDHALTGAAIALPAPVNPTTEIPYELNGGTANVIALGYLSTSLAFLNSALPGAPNQQCAPALVQQIGLLADYALARYQAFTLRSPRPAGVRLKIRVCDVTYGGQGYLGETRPYWDHVRINCGASADQIVGTVPHEIIHRVQFQYNPSVAAGSDMQAAMREGGARFAEDCVDDVPNRYIRDCDPQFNQPWRSIVPFTNTAGTAFAGFDYEAGVFWKYLAEQLGRSVTEPAVGIDAHRAILEATATVDAAGAPLTASPGEPFGYDPALLRKARTQMSWPGDFDRFAWFDASRSELSTHETTWGNFVIANLLHGTNPPPVDARFRYLEDHEPVPGHALLASMSANVLPADAALIAAGVPVVFAQSPEGPPWGVRYYRLVPDPAAHPGLVRITLAASGATSPLTQIILVTPQFGLRDIHRFDQVGFVKTVNMNGLGAVFVIVANRDSPGQHGLTVTPVAQAPLITATRWNTVHDTSYEVDPRSWSWTWTSPDIMVDTDNDLSADSQVFFDQNNALKIRLTNRGNDAGDASVAFWYQKASPSLSPAAWIPVADLGGGVQTATTSLAAGASTWLSVQWAPVDDGTHHPHWCVKAVITVADDSNADDKIVLSNFSNLVVRSQAVPPLSQVVWPVKGLPNALHVVSPTREWRHANPRAVAQALNGAPGTAPAGGDCGPALTMRHGRESLTIDIALRKGGGGSGSLPAHPDTLPPGVSPERVVTVVQTAGGRTLGGVTWRLVDDAPSATAHDRLAREDRTET